MSPVRPTVARHRRVLVALAALGLLLGACSSSADDGSATATTADPAVAAGVNYSSFGPFKVGTRSIEAGGVEVELFYPVSPDDTATGSAVTSLSSDVAFPESLRTVIAEAAPFLIQQLPVELYQGASVSGDGPFPVLLYSHGAGGHPAFYVNTMAHSASWGYVVAAPNHPSRNLAANVGGTGAQAATTDVEDLVATVAALDTINADANDPLHLAMDTERLSVAGHSAGGGAAARLAVSDEAITSRLVTIIGQAPAPPVSLSAIIGNPDATEEERSAALEAALAELTPPSLPVLLVAGERDAVIPLARVEANYLWLDAPKQLVVLANAGHNPVLDVCAPIRAQGGLVAAAGGLSEAFGPSVGALLARGEDGCVEGYLDPQTGFDVTRHLTVAQLRWALGQDPGRASLEPTFLRDTFGTAIGVVEQDVP